MSAACLPRHEERSYVPNTREKLEKGVGNGERI